MRFRAAAFTALTLAIALTAVGIVSAEESSWWPRWLSPTSQKADPDKLTADKDETPKPPPIPLAAKRAARLAKQAKADWERRTDVLNKLRGIAVENGDDDLLRLVEQLETRNWDLYRASTNDNSKWDEPEPEPDAKKGKRK